MTSAGAAQHFAHVRDWVFDLDNTLYPASCNLFAEIDHRMTSYVGELLGLGRDEAYRVQKDLYATHGTTLAGLMRQHDVDPHAFMEYVHAIDLSILEPAPDLRAAIAALPGRKFVHTNGSAQHAANVLGKMGLGDVIDDVFDVEMSGWVPKPRAENYDASGAHFGIDTQTTAMFEDMAVNLEEPHRRGMTTVLVTSDAEWIDSEPTKKRPGVAVAGAEHIHHTTGDLTRFLTGLIAG
ncbi:MAG: pyrimidine 5'-nucleotidase [Pseudomonadota bacterium]